jgi:hypothetical protein
LDLQLVLPQNSNGYGDDDSRYAALLLHAEEEDFKGKDYAGKDKDFILLV